MLYKTGNVYLAEIDFEGNIHNIKMRPVVVIEMMGNRVRVVPISSNVTSNNPKTYFMHLRLKGSQRRVCLRYDKMCIIEASDLKTQVGEISSEQLKIMLNSFKYDIKDDRVSANQDVKEPVLDSKKNKEDNQSVCIKVKEGTEEIWEKYLQNINEKVNMMSDPKTIWRERIIGFIFGVMASLVATLIVAQ